MTTFYIAFDELDAKLGTYFLQSKDDIVNFISDNYPNFSMTMIPSELCNENHINEIFNNLEDSKFIFLAYSHGNNDSLHGQNSWYIRTPQNISSFKNTFFYSMACNTGKQLGFDLVHSGCSAFIGYSSTAYAALTEERNTFIQCDNFGFKEFLHGKTVDEAFKGMKLFMRDNIKRLVRERKGLIAGYLRSNLASLVIHGNKTFVIGDLELEEN